MRAYNQISCKGTVSIQCEINSIAESTGKGWEQKITSQKWREIVRLRLRERTDEWCDYKAATCMCL